MNMTQPPEDRAKLKRGYTLTREYRSWSSMIQRCENPKTVGYRSYGARGVTVCARWRRSFAAFLEDLGPRPEGMTLDRIDPHGNYEPGNCRWATLSVQARNTKRFLRPDEIPIDQRWPGDWDAINDLGRSSGCVGDNTEEQQQGNG